MAAHPQKHTHTPTHPHTHAHIQAIPLHSTLTFSSCVSVKQAEQFVMSESPGAAIQQKVKRSVGKGWCTKPSLPPSVSLSHSHTLGRTSISPAATAPPLTLSSSGAPSGKNRIPHNSYFDMANLLVRSRMQHTVSLGQQHQQVAIFILMFWGLYFFLPMQLILFFLLFC